MSDDSSARDTQTWLPIETAPRDGTPILIFEPDEDCKPETGMDVIWWEGSREEGCWLFGNCDEYMRPFTHWMPLPPPPGKRQ